MVSTSVPTEDGLLIEETLQGSTEAFGKLMVKHQPKAMSTALRILGNPQEAEDIVQQVFIEAYRHLKQFQGNAQFSTWLYSIVLNRCRNHIRHRKRHQTFSLDASMGDKEDGSPSMQFADHNDQHERVLENRFEAEWVREKVGSLPKDYRDIFVLHYFYDTPLNDIAQQLGRPLGTVKVYLHRARKELHRRWGEQRDKKVNGANPVSG